MLPGDGCLEVCVCVCCVLATVAGRYGGSVYTVAQLRIGGASDNI